MAPAESRMERCSCTDSLSSCSVRARRIAARRLKMLTKMNRTCARIHNAMNQNKPGFCSIAVCSVRAKRRRPDPEKISAARKASESKGVFFDRITGPGGLAVQAVKGARPAQSSWQV